ncbi:hypothetical protein [Streptomyces sp. CAU 1734]|uniref:hypothetical protein n=1 Tax=Streptomyces sp. CAU 1734 TaxID=3140360 RepID=UPI003261223B
MTVGETSSVAVELERMRGTFETGMTKLDGKLDVLVERGTHADRRMSAAEQAAAALTARVAAVERRVWMASGAATMLGAGGGYLFAVLGG